MPIYEYQCPDCGYQFEQLQKISDEPIRVCPNCEQTHLRKLVSQTSFVLKGGGWYKDHYGLKSKSEGASGAKEGASGAKEPSSTGPDKQGDKPAEKPATPAPSGTDAKPAAASTASASTPPKKTPSSAA